MKKKVLLMGKSSVGKTSMRSVIFTTLVPNLTSRLGATLDVEQNSFKFLGSFVLNLWDAGGQESFINSYLSSQKTTVFSNVEILIFVFDINSPEKTKELEYYRACVEALSKHSPEAGVFVLIHKMDLIPRRDRQAAFLQRRAQILAASGSHEKVRTFGTSIWDESLYKAWSRMVHTLIPNSGLLDKHLSTLARSCGAQEVVLFERGTFLVVARSNDTHDLSDDLIVSLSSNNAPPEGARLNEYGRRPIIQRERQGDEDTATSLSSPSSSILDDLANAERPASGLPVDRFEKISEMIKVFRHSCVRFGESFQSLQIRFPHYTAVLDSLTPTIYVLIVVPDTDIYPAAIAMNVRLARPKFAEVQASMGTV